MWNLRRATPGLRRLALCAVLLAVALPRAWGQTPVVTVAEGRQLAEHLRIAWRADIPKEPYHGVRTLYIEGGVVFVECTYNLLIALDEVTGKALWVIKTPGPLDFPPSSHKDRLFLFVKESLHQVDRATGKPLAEPKNPHLGILTTAGADSTYVFVTAADGKVHGVRQSDVWPGWTRGMETLAIGSAMMPPNRLFIVTQDSELLSVEGATGEFRWRIKLGPKAPLTGPAVSGHNVYVAGRDLFVRCFSHGGMELWKTPVGGVAMCPPTIARNRVFATTGPERVAQAAVMDAEDGKLLWRQPGPSRFLTASSERAYFLATHKGQPLKVLGFDLDDGKPQGALDARDFHSFVASPASGRFIAATADGKVYGIADLPAPEE